MKILEFIRDYLTVVYVGIMYRKMVRTCERLHAASETGARYCAASAPYNPLGIIYVDRSKYRKLKRECGFDRRDNRKFGDFVAGSWYYTAGYQNNRPMAPADREARRRVFVRTMTDRIRRAEEQNRRTRKERRERDAAMRRLRAYARGRAREKDIENSK